MKGFLLMIKVPDQSNFNQQRSHIGLAGLGQLEGLYV